MSAPSPVDRLGLPEFTFADLHEPARLADLYARFVTEVTATEPALWERWTAQAAAPPGPVDTSALLVAMAPHVSRFVARLFSVGPEAEVLAAATRAYDDLFRFKIDFMRRRALPLLKGGAPVAVSAEDHAYVDAIVAGAGDAGARELLVARAGCALLDRDDRARTSGDDAEKAAVAAEIDHLKRWCAAHVHHPAHRDWVVFKFPETLDYEHLVQIARPNAALPNAITGPDGHLRRRDGFALTDARYSTRQVLSEVHYCVLCHERDKDTLLARASSTRRARCRPTRWAFPWPAARSTRRSRRCTSCASGATCSAPSRSSCSTTRCARAPAIASATTA